MDDDCSLLWLIIVTSVDNTFIDNNEYVTSR